MPKRLFGTILSACLFAFSQPSEFFPRGLGALAFFFLIPALVGLRGIGAVRAAAQGALFAIFGFGLMNHWLCAYDPRAPLLVLPLLALQYALLFAVLALIEEGLPQAAWLLQPLAWVGLEYLRTLGFLGYPYGIVGYALYEQLPLIQVASVTGVYGVSALALLPQSVLVSTFAAEGSGTCVRSRRGGMEAVFACPAQRRRNRLCGARLRGAIALGLCAAAYGAGLVRLALPSQRGQSIELALVQPNFAPGTEGASTTLTGYKAALAALEEESRAAIRSGAELVVWPETAFVPSILYHLRHRPDREIFELVRECYDFIAASGASFLIGNSHSEALPGGARGGDYNAALAFPSGGGEPGLYCKTRLVPFGEWFPYARLLPRFAAVLAAKAGGFWEPGPGPASLALCGTHIAAPICYEDCFGDYVRAMAAGPVGLIVPLVSDSWARSEAAERQHFAASVFRAVETGKPLARATNTGVSAVVDARGYVRAELPRGQRGVLRARVEATTGVATVYSVLGDGFAQAALGLVLGATLVSAVELALRRAAALQRPKPYRGRRSPSSCGLFETTPTEPSARRRAASSRSSTVQGRNS